MGIRLSCPNGHPLHVKSELAGKRGICPQCQARFLIPGLPAAQAVPQTQAKPAAAGGGAGSPAPAQPLPSTQAAAPNPGAATGSVAPQSSPSAPDPTGTVGPQSVQPAPAAGGIPPAATPVAASPPQGGAPQAIPLPATPVPAQPVVSPPAAAGAPVAPAVPQGPWYVRPSAGGQYGPADEQLLRQWIAERRVDSAALVWCAGWTDWQPISALSGLFPTAFPAALPTGAPQAAPAGFEIPTGDAAAANPTAVATARYIRRKKRSAHGQLMAAGVLLLLALILGGVLLWVLNRNPGGAPATPSPRVTTPAAPADPAEGADVAVEADQPEVEAME